jgi:catechol 2,3-dioxygenase-like lactoylglutathione lyase family enzyme
MSQETAVLRLDTVVVFVRDREAAEQWYESVLGLSVEVSDRGSNATIMRVSEAGTLTLWEVARRDDLPQLGLTTTFPVFAVSDGPAMHRKLLDQGLVVSPLRDSTVGRHFFFLDPDGNRLGVVELFGARS